MLVIEDALLGLEGIVALGGGQAQHLSGIQVTEAGLGVCVLYFMEKLIQGSSPSGWRD